MPYESPIPLVLSAETVRDYILSRGGRVYNTELVKYFKPLLVHPETKDAAREEFKRIINRIAVVLRDDRDEKYLILKRGSNEQSPITSPEPSLSYSSSFSSLPTGAPLSPTFDPSTSVPSICKQPPPYRSPPPVTPPKMLASPGTCASPAASESSMEKTPPPVPPRRRSSDKIKFNNKENESVDGQRNSTISDEGENKIADEQKISVKERTQIFNRLASTEEPITKIPQATQSSAACKKRFDKGSLHDRDEDCVSVTSFDPRSREWMVKAAKNDYQGLAKLCADNPRLAEVKDPATGYTALHWGAKHGNMDIVKLIAGNRKVNANIRTNGGYTPLHIACQFNREDVCDLLIKVYGADPNLRDWSGRKPFQYKNTNNRNSSLKMDSIRKTKSQKKHSEKDSGFLRMGSLNVRVKRTTEAVSNFLGVSQSNLDKAHKTWGSADSLQDCRKMPPPSSFPPKKRKPKQHKDGSNSSSVISESKTEEKSDSDSDSAVGFGPQWKQTV